jgi:putative ABC transport system permease protein
MGPMSIGFLVADIRLAARALARRPAYAVLAVATLALGIGANTTIFSLIDATLLRVLPFGEPQQLLAVWEKNPSGNARNRVSPANYSRWQERSRSFESVAAHVAWPTTISGTQDAVRVPAGIVTPNFFETLRARPLHGRALVPADGAAGAQEVVVLGERLWRSRYASDPGIVGRPITVEGRPFVVVGVMPSHVELPVGSQLWMPLTIDEKFRDRPGRFLTGVARLKPGVTLEEASAEMEVIARGIEAERPQYNTGWAVSLSPLQADLVGPMRGQLLLLMAGVVLLLVMACVNVASLTLSRALSRMREFAVRSALGAGRGRLLRQFLTESLVLCALGGAAGLFLAHAALRAVVAAAPSEVPGFMEPRINLPVIAFTLGACVAAALITAAVPALRLSSSPLLPALKEGHAAGGVGPGRHRLRGMLVASQVALAIVLVAGGGLLLRSFVRLTRVDAGFDARQVLSVDISLPETGYQEPPAQARFFTEAARALAEMPGVEAAGGMSWPPFVGGSRTAFELPDRPAPAVGQEPGADVRFVTPGIFGALGIRLLEGRDFGAEDTAERETVAVVSEGLARRYWPGQSAIGRRVRMEWDGWRDARIVGVAADVRHQALDEPSYDTIYWSHAQVPSSFMTLFVRSSSVPAETLAAGARAAVAGIDRGVAVETKPFTDIVRRSVQTQSFTLHLTLTFGLSAVLLAAIGLFGVVGQAVGERRREFALRVALGARRSDIGSLVLGEGFKWTGVGVVVGLPLAFAAGRVLQGFLFEVSAADPATYGAVVAVLGTTALLAVLVPAWRAARVDPKLVLRAD